MPAVDGAADAARPSTVRPGVWGCALSHAAVWRRLLEHGHESALVLEDDAEFPAEFAARFAEAWPRVPSDWDIVFLGTYHRQPPIPVAVGVVQVVRASAAHAYAIRPRACRELLRRSHPAEPIDRTLASLMRLDDWRVYALSPNLAWQAAGHSDIAGGSVDYSDIRENRLLPISRDFWSDPVTCLELGHLGRLGNQLFQIAAVLGAAVRANLAAKFPPWPAAERFAGLLDHVLDPQQPFVRWQEPHFHFAEIPARPSLDLSGYFQSERYFEHCRQLVRSYFAPSAEVADHLADRWGRVLEDQPVSVHVRRGDYLSRTDRHPTLPEAYYRRALAEFPGRRVLVFSDDPAWCQKAEVFDRPGTVFVTGQPEWLDLHLMSRCRDHIIANSSFSWWGAWLNPRAEKRVIAPEPSRWFGPALAHHDTRDLLPASWTRTGWEG